MNNGSDESISALVTSDYVHGFPFTKKSMRGCEMPRSDGHLFVWLGFNIAKPVRIGAKTVHHYDLGAFLSILDNFEDGLTPQAGTAAGMRQQQQPLPKEPA